MGAKCSYFLIQVEWLDHQEVSEVGTELTRKLLRMQFNNLQQPAIGCCTTFEKLFHPVLALTFQGDNCQFRAKETRCTLGVSKTLAQDLHVLIKQAAEVSKRSSCDH